MPMTPAALSASFTSSSLKGLMMAVISFMVAPCQVAWSDAGVVGGLGVLGEVEADLLFLDGDLDADRRLQREHQQQGDGERPGDRDAVGQRLLEQQRGVAAVEDALVERAVEERRVGEEADEQRADEAADEVDADDVERVVVAELGLQADGEAADDAGSERR